MAGVEARRRRLKYKVYKKVRYAEHFARRLGVGQVSYGGRIDIANVCNHGLFLAREQGVPMPRAVLVRAFTEEDDPNELASYQPGVSNTPGEIEVNKGHEGWNDMAATMREAQENRDFATGDPRHPIVHELGELAMHQSVGLELYNPHSAEYAEEEEDFQQEDMAHVYDVLGDRATLNHGEFVAEVFAALLLGRAEELKADEEIMPMYGRYGGLRIRDFDRAL
jgi:hypothetical protein